MRTSKRMNETGGHYDDAMAEAEGLLVRARPEPSAEAVQRIERRLFTRPSPSLGRPRVRRLVLGAACAGAAAAAVVAASLGDGGPLGASDEVRARETCRWVLEPRRERHVVVVPRADGEPTLSVRWRTVTRPARRCR